MSKRINIILPDTTAALLARVATRRTRSRFIDRAVRQLVETEGKANLRVRLKQEALENAERDLAIAAEWFAIEEEGAKLAETSRGRKALRKRA